MRNYINSKIICVIWSAFERLNGKHFTVYLFFYVGKKLNEAGNYNLLVWKEIFNTEFTAWKQQKHFIDGVFFQCKHMKNLFNLRYFYAIVLKMHVIRALKDNNEEKIFWELFSTYIYIDNYS